MSYIKTSPSKPTHFFKMVIGVCLLCTTTNCAKDAAAAAAAAANDTTPKTSTSYTTVSDKFSADYIAGPHYTGLTAKEKNILKKLPNAILQEINKERALLDSFWWGSVMTQKWVSSGGGGASEEIYPNKSFREQYHPRSQYAAKPHQYGQNNNRARAVKTHDMLNQSAQEFAEDMAITGLLEHDAPSRKVNNAKQTPGERVKRSNFYLAPDIKVDKTYRYKTVFKKAADGVSFINEKFIDSFTIATEVASETNGVELSESIQGGMGGESIIPFGWEDRSEDDIAANIANNYVAGWAASIKGHRENQYSMVAVYIGVGVATRIVDGKKGIYACLKCY